MENLTITPEMKAILGKLAHELNRKKIITTLKEVEQLNFFQPIKSWNRADKTLFFKAFLVSTFLNEMRKKAVIEALLKSELDFDEALFVFLIDNHLNKDRSPHRNWQMSIKRIEQFIDNKTLYPDLLEALDNLIARFNAYNFSDYTPKIEQSLRSIITQLKEINNNSQSTNTLTIMEILSTTNPPIKSFVFSAQDELGDWGNAYIKLLNNEDKNALYKILHLAVTANAGKPSAKWYAALKSIQNEGTQEGFKQHIKTLIKFAGQAKIIENTYSYPSKILFAKSNVDTLKGIIWASLLCYDKEILQLLAQLVDKSFQKIAGIGPAAAAVGNAALYVLANVEGLDGVNYLSRLKLKIKQANTQALIEKYLNEAAELRQVSKLDLEDIANDDFGLNTEGVRTDVFGDYKAELRVIGLGKTEIKWLKPDILMTPNDQYLCIVPDRSKPKEEGVFLPFEGDAGLSVIISKALLLAADDKITDTTITRQIHNHS